jgi:hypothetical protein
VSAARAVSTTLSVALVLLLAPVGTAGAAEAPRQSASGGARHGVAKHAPNGPPLSSVPAFGEGGDSGVPSGEGDPLVENGLSSPLCRGAMSGGLSTAARTNCQTSGFVGASAPTGDYGIDVHIDVGPLGLSKGGLLSVIQDLFVTPVWNALVWIVHALVVMLEWCYTLELLGGSTMGGVARSLREAQASFTEPWLALVLAAASVLALYNGLIRRRVTETLGQALMTIAMMGFGLWVIADPLGTVGAVGRWANQASLGTLGAIAQGTPVDAPRTLADSMRALFAGAIEMPWCYLEFGNVRWCSDPALLDPRLHKAGILIEARQKAMIGCEPSTVAQLCATPGSPAALAVERSDRLMGQATTNGALFLAFPANGPERNAITEQGSLLRVLCQSADDTKCIGPTAAQAEFRSASGTFPRMIGVVLITIGVLGMVMLLGLIALHLLAAAVVSLFMLLLAPFAVLAPALGDGGRAVFGGWATRLLGAVTSKLLFSFLLGALLTMQRMLTSLQPLGWWTEWLLISAFWWTVFLKRHRALALIQSRGRETVAHSRRPVSRSAGRRPGALPARGRRSGSGRAGGARERPAPISHPVRWAWDKFHSPAPATEQLRPRDQASHGAVSKRHGKRARRPGLAQAHAGQPAHASPDTPARMLAKRAQLERVRSAREAALAGGKRRRAIELAVRERRIEAEMASDRRSQRATAIAGEVARLQAESGSAPEQRGRGTSQLDGHAAAPAGSKRGKHGHGDRELVARPMAIETAHASARRPAHAERSTGERELDPAREEREWAGSSPRRLRSDSRPADRRSLGSGDSSGSGGSSTTGVDDARLRASERKSRVMDDARAVAERRKRQLGYGPSQ